MSDNDFSVTIADSFVDRDTMTISPCSTGYVQIACDEWSSDHHVRIDLDLEGLDLLIEALNDARDRIAVVAYYMKGRRS